MVKHSTRAKPRIILPKNRRVIMIVLAVVVVIVLGAAIFFAINHRSDNTGGSNDAGTSDTDLSPEVQKSLGAKRAEQLLASPPKETASTEQKSTYYDELLTTLQDEAIIISTYESARAENTPLSPGAMSVVASAYLHRNLTGDKEKALAALDVGRQYIKAQAHTTGDGGTDEMLRDVDTTQKGLGL